MAPDHDVPVLAALVLVPAMGALVVVALGRSRDVLASWLAFIVAGVVLALALWGVLGFPGGLSESYPWIPTLGVSFALESDGLSSILVVWVAASTLLALAASLPGHRSATLMLVLEASAVGLVLSRDVFLMFACLGAAIAVVSLLSTAPRRVLAFATAGMTLLFGWFAQMYQMVDAQTGFPSTHIGRWRALVLYPHEEPSLFLLAALGIALVMVALALAVGCAARAHRPVALAVSVILGSVVVLRLIVPLVPQGAEAWSSWVLGFAVLSMVVAALGGALDKPGGWTMMALGYQALVLFGLFSFQENVATGATLIMIAASVGFFGLALTPSRGLAWWFALFVVGTPIASMWVPAWRADASWLVAGVLAFAGMAYRVVHSVKTMSLDPNSTDASEDAAALVRRARLVSALLVVVLSVSMIVGWSRLAVHVQPSTASFINGP